MAKETMRPHSNASKINSAYFINLIFNNNYRNNRNDYNNDNFIDKREQYNVLYPVSDERVYSSACFIIYRFSGADTPFGCAFMSIE